MSTKTFFNFNLEKSHAAKRQPTKDKYLNLARSTIETGLQDEFANKGELEILLNLIK